MPSMPLAIECKLCICGSMLNATLGTMLAMALPKPDAFFMPCFVPLASKGTKDG